MAQRTIANRYELEERILPGDSARGIPEVWQAHDAGDVYFAKLWARGALETNAIRALWNHEVRSLSRLQGYPGASELFVRLHDLGMNNNFYYAILDGGQRGLLSTKLRDRRNFHWLLNLSEAGRRRPLWEGLLRIAEALSVLHSEGTLHRSLSSSSVFSGPDGGGDFRLSGFEWSLRVGREGRVASTVHSSYRAHAPELDGSEPEFSMLTDWFDFGLLVAEVFGINVSQFGTREAVRSAVENLAQLRRGERDAILHFLQENPEQRVSSGEAATQYLRNILTELNTATTGAGRNLIFAVRLGTNLDISRAIAMASKSKAPAHDPISQRNWIEHDLRGDPKIIARTARFPHFVIRGEMLEYRIRQWEIDGLKTWDLGYCDSLESPRTEAGDQYFSLGQRKLEIVLYPYARKNRQTLRDHSAPWERLFAFRKPRSHLSPDLRTVHDFFRITQQMETALTAAQICPVTILSVERGSTETEITVTPREEFERNQLAQSLKFGPPSEQMRDWFDLGAESVEIDDENDPSKDEYQLLDGRTILSEGTSTVWQFLRARPDRSGPRYTFRCQASVPVRQGPSYLAKNYGGTIAQIRRRYKAIEDLRTHENLLKLIADTNDVTRVVGDRLPPERCHVDLDCSKVRALIRIWRTLPFFAIQGPPGTGKTTLIKAFCDRLLASDQTSQILITAHSHHTVDDVLFKLHRQFGELKPDQQPIMIRIGARSANVCELSFVSRTMLARLQSSEMFKSAPDFLKNRIQNALMDASTRDEAAATDERTIRLLVQDAANITFTTSNSGELADITGRGKRFDWSIIEEAGKAHGFDMAAALQASHRLLLIGDHHQLPPFNAGVFKDLLDDPLRVKKAIQLAAPFAPGLIDVSLTDDDDEVGTFEERCGRWRQMVNLFSVLFEASVTGHDLKRGPASTLTNQHRMHPDIADLVGRIFYPDGEGGTIIRSPKETHDEFGQAPPYAIAPHSWLPQARIVWVDVPWVQKKEFALGESDGLFSAPKEAQAIVEILDQLRPTGAKCELQILSPYNDQLDTIRSEIESAKTKGRLSHMFAPPFDLREGKRLGATVDEFQGSEADIVIVSLVRNNGLVPWKSIGFLKEPNRMNVLLSRARQKLVIVGSWDFFDSRCSADTPANEPYSYIGRMMAVMSTAKSDGKLAKYCYAR